MATIFPEMGGNAVSTSLLCHFCSTQWVRVRPAAGVADRRDMINIDSQTQKVSAHCPAY